MKVVALLIVLCLVGTYAKSEEEYRTSFVQYMRKYSKTYSHDDFRARYSIFKDNVDIIDSINAEGRGYTVAINKFADMTNQEFQRFLGTKVTPNTVRNGEELSFDDVQLPVAWDWSAKGAVTPIKNQGQCGSCWSFSTTGSTEGCHFIKTGTLVSLSEQNLMDCSTAQGNDGCDGGLMTQAMDYIISNKGVDTEASYPYTAEDGTCQFNAANVGATLKSYKNIPNGNENALQAAVYVGPVSIAIDASQSSFQFYSSGVYYDPACSTSQLDHGVLAVGWGVDQSSSTPFWIVKNSWGTDWGLNGYIHMIRNHNNACGVASMATLPSC